MRCTICGKQGVSAEQELWGPEFAHSTCVIAFKQGQIDGQEGLKKQVTLLRDAVKMSGESMDFALHNRDLVRKKLAEALDATKEVG